MRTKSLILLVLALGCGLVASIGISQVIQAQRQSGGSNIETEQIVVALKEIKPGSKITPDMIELGNWDKTRIPDGAMRSIEQVINYKLPLKANIVKGEPLLESKFQSGGSPANTIPDGYVLTAIPADATSAVGNLLQPGDRVNVSWSMKGIGAGGANSISKTILHNIRVFSVNSIWQEGTPNGEKKTETEGATKYVNLVVTESQANVLGLCQVHGGSLKLTLRPPGSANKVDQDSDTADINRLLGEKAPSGNSADAENKGKEKTEGFLKGLGESLKDLANGAANLPKTQQAAEPSDVETFRTTIIDGSVPRIVEIYRSKETGGRWVQRETTGSKIPGLTSSGGTDPTGGIPSLGPDKSSSPNQSTQDIIKSLNSGL
jgi:pilus assembly protein CpaB